MGLPAIVRVIHIVVDAVQPSIAGTTVLAGRTSRGSRALKRCIGDGISSAGARLALKDVEETEPMADLMGCRSTLVIVGGGASGYRLGEDIAAVLVEGGVPRRYVRGEVANPEESAAEVGEEVDVQVGVSTFSKGRLHFRVVVAGGPVVVHGEVGTDEGEADT